MTTTKRTHRHDSRGGGRYATVTPRRSSRPVGAEVRALLWLCRHPGLLLVPALLAGIGYWAGVAPTGIGCGVVVVGVLVWWRVHPASYDRWAAPWIRTFWRRWSVYAGRRWVGIVEDCELTRTGRTNGATLAPRVLRVRSITPSIDTLTVRMVRGQHLEVFTDRAPALADALGAHRVAVTRRRPGVLTMVVERRMPFTSIVPAAPIPDAIEDITLNALDVGDAETGQPFLLRVRGKHLLVAGQTGAGKSSLLWNPLRALGPMIREGWVRLWVIDLKGGTETDRGERLFHRWATTGADAVALLGDFRDSMRTRQQRMRAEKTRTNTLSPDTPLELLIIDEMAMLTAYGERGEVREALRLLAEVLTQGRSADHLVWGYVQEPSKDVIDVRDLFTTRICLAVTTASHVDMVLGEGVRDRGALADQIPGGPEHAGIGFVIDQHSRLPVRLRIGCVSDRDIDELVNRCAPPVRTTTTTPPAPTPLRGAGRSPRARGDVA